MKEKYIFASVDFDHTLTRKDVQEFVKELLTKYKELNFYITTSRFDDDNTHKYTIQSWKEVSPPNNDLYKLLEEFGRINKEDVYFTNMIPKGEHLQHDNDFIFHIDDDELEIESLKYHHKIKPIWLGHEDWKEQCIKIIENELNS